MKSTVHHKINHRSWRKGLMTHTMTKMQFTVGVEGLYNAMQPMNGYNVLERKGKQHSYYPLPLK